MNATAKRIDHLFKKSSIVFWHFSVITSRAPRGCQRKCTEAVLLLLIKAVNQGSQYFFFFFFLSIFLSLDVFVSLRSKPWWKEKPDSSSKQENFSCLFNAALFKANFWFVQSFFFLSAAILFLHILFISFLSVDSATSKNIWVHYTVVAAQRNAVFFAPKDSRRKLYEICEILSIISLFKFKISFDLKVFLNNSFLSQITCIIVLQILCDHQASPP